MLRDFFPLPGYRKICAPGERCPSQLRRSPSIPSIKFGYVEEENNSLVVTGVV